MAYVCSNCTQMLRVLPKCCRSTKFYETRITGWAVAQTCCISQCSKYRKSVFFGYPWEQNPWTDRHETWGT